MLIAQNTGNTHAQCHQERYGDGTGGHAAGIKGQRQQAHIAVNHQKQRSGKQEHIKEHQNIYKDDCSACLSLLSLLEYSKGNFDNSLHYLDDAKFLAEQKNSAIELILNEVITGFINYAEKNNSLYTINYNKAKKLAQIKSILYLI